jgi:hypothetical protein
MAIAPLSANRPVAAATMSPNAAAALKVADDFHQGFVDFASAPSGPAHDAGQKAMIAGYSPNVQFNDPLFGGQKADGTPKRTLDGRDQTMRMWTTIGGAGITDFKEVAKFPPQVKENKDGSVTVTRRFDVNYKALGHPVENHFETTQTLKKGPDGKFQIESQQDKWNLHDWVQSAVLGRPPPPARPPGQPGPASTPGDHLVSAAATDFIKVKDGLVKTEDFFKSLASVKPPMRGWVPR